MPDLPQRISLAVHVQGELGNYRSCYRHSLFSPTCSIAAFIKALLVADHWLG